MKEDFITALMDELRSRLKDFMDEDMELFLDFLNRFPTYSIRNQLLIFLQNSNARYVASYGTWKKEFGRQVRKGERAIKIIAPCKKKVISDDGNEETLISGFRYINVFDISQTEGKPFNPPKIMEVLDGEMDNFPIVFQALSEISPVPISFEEMSSNIHGYYSLPDKRIALNRELSSNETMCIKTLIHEISHSILHDRETGTEKDIPVKQMEIQAECCSYIICRYLSINPEGFSLGYIASYSGKNLEDFENSYSPIQYCCKLVIDGLQSKLLTN